MTFNILELMKILDFYLTLLLIYWCSKQIYNKVSIKYFLYHKKHFIEKSILF